jgi:stage III sporulation protein AD
LGIVAAILIVIIRQQRPEIAIQISIITGVVIFLLLASRLKVVLDMLEGFSRKAGIDTVYFVTVLKIIGIAYISEFGAEICRDAGESSIASKIELAARVVIIVLAVPIMSSLINMIIKIMP